ncbi:MAG TPA: hypothetical protein DCG84_07225 [Peptococcaceae bacterium]|nr:hypothetical protein [Peptococcaceae bacterium]
MIRFRVTPSGDMINTPFRNLHCYCIIMFFSDLLLRTLTQLIVTTPLCAGHPIFSYLLILADLMEMG